MGFFRETVEEIKGKDFTAKVEKSAFLEGGTHTHVGTARTSDGQEVVVRGNSAGSVRSELLSALRSGKK
jgi:hypothetical protein